MGRTTENMALKYNVHVSSVNKITVPNIQQLKICAIPNQIFIIMVNGKVVQLYIIVNTTTVILLKIVALMEASHQLLCFLFDYFNQT